jgi:putative pyruvate formate lyase activating enzyme
MDPFRPAYRTLPPSALQERVQQAAHHLAHCDLCPRRCGIDRLSGRTTPCRSGARALVYSYGPHHGEEHPLSGTRGSGTIFFSGCNLSCVFCQNWELSQGRGGQEASDEELARMMLELQEKGCHNINLVTPSHVVPQILGALAIAAAGGLNLPLVYNTGGYDSPRALALLDGVIDIYMPDMKFADSATARPFVGVPDYAEVNRAAVSEMHRQVGDLILDAEGVARRGLLVRHLVLPQNAGGTDAVLSYLAREISVETYINLMDQYRPCYRADEYPPLDRRPTRAEFREAVAVARALGLHRLDRP